MIIRAVDLNAETIEGPRGGSGTATRLMYDKASEFGGQITAFALMDIHAGTEIGYHVHEDDIEMYFMLDGLATVSDNGDICNLEPGDLMITKQGEGHSLKNSTDKPLTFLALVLK